MSFLGELSKRNVVKVGITYVVVAWVLAQVVDLVLPTFDTPAWVTQTIIFLLILGFPLVLVIAWAFEITPSGIVRTPILEDVTDENSGAAGDPGTLDKAEKRETLPNSVAVLPFENLSPNPDDEYFAAGIHEEVLNYLTKIKDLNVIARTSVKRYARTSKSVSKIGKELAVGTIMEGSVRYARDRVRVTAQLIDASAERHLWSEIYERDLSDVFAIQADIAKSIAQALHAEFSAAEKQSLEALPTTVSSEAHALYLKSLALFGEGDTAIAVTAPHSTRATIHSLLDRALVQDPDFAHPHALKALLFAVARIYDPISKDDWLTRCVELDEAVRLHSSRALELNPDLGTPYFALALNHQFGWRWRQARADYEQAVGLRPSDATILPWYATLNLLVERYEDGIRLAERATSLDPDNIWAWHILGLLRHLHGDYDASVEAYEKASAAHPESPLPYLHGALPKMALGRDASALQSLKIADQLMPGEAAPAIHVHLAYAFARLGQAADAHRVVARVQASVGDRFVDSVIWALAAMAKGDTDEAIEWLTRAVERPEMRQEVFGEALFRQNWWQDPALREARFVELVNRLGGK